MPSRAGHHPGGNPVNELVETSFAVEEELGVARTSSSTVLPEVAGLDIDLDDLTAAELALNDDERTALALASAFRAGRATLQTDQLERLADLLPLTQIRFPQLFGTTVGPDEIAQLAERLNHHHGSARTGVAMTTATTFGELVDTSQVIICCGTGGVGKTTTSAAVALAAAQSGRRACVVTIDPAKRLADARYR